MFDALPMDQYKANYADILHGNPLRYGNMRGQVLLKDKYRRDFNDFDLVLRRNVPAKYTPYFELPTLFSAESSADDYDEIEIGRSSPSKTGYNLSPLKTNRTSGSSNVAFKDSENLVKMDNNIFNDDETKYLGKRKKISRKKPMLVDDLDSLVERTYSYIDSNLHGDSRLDKMVSSLVGRLRQLKIENDELKKQERSADGKPVNNRPLSRGIRFLIGSYKEKIEEYTLENSKLRRELKAQQEAQQEAQLERSKEEEEKEKEHEKPAPLSRDLFDDPDVQHINTVILQLEKKREKLIKEKQEAKVLQLQAEKAQSAASTAIPMAMPVININLSSEIMKSLTSQVMNEMKMKPQSAPEPSKANFTEERKCPLDHTTIKLGSTCPVCQKRPNENEYRKANRIDSILSSGRNIFDELPRTEPLVSRVW
ncbi:hypothetical protein FOA43_004811 [Brettanomyces nanus]|uniref:Uncharacterized protein n=1 Tax=Eeniella nana TaxID=13502 RepID=A0A875S948_EENNA|nr:uncharacterized protein FOA43_004811 [Brettanomyces nanus]QPG77398.1 hypothetical protein FOA43_004811 [Brettanomyces nanus]